MVRLQSHKAIVVKKKTVRISAGGDVGSYSWKSRLMYTALATMLVMLVAPVGADAKEWWWPIQVKSHYGRYEPVGKKRGYASRSLSRPRLEVWNAPAVPQEYFTIGVCIPHLKDTYWVAINYGIIDEARRLGVGIKLVEAGGYDNLSRQQGQMRELIRDGLDGIILGSISYTGNDMLVAEAAEQGIPVVEVVNDIMAPKIAAKALVSFYEMGYAAGEYVAEHAEKVGRDNVTVSFFPGPRGSGWAPETMDGFLDALDYYRGKVEIRDVSWGDTGAEKQRELLLQSLERIGPVDYIVGNALVAEVANEVLQQAQMPQATVVATYLIPSLYDMIRKGHVAAAPSDLTVFQGRMAVDMMVRVLSGEEAGIDFPFRSGPFMPMVTPENIDRYPYEGLFGPRDYEPVFELNPGR